MTAAKKPRAKRPPRKVWLVVDALFGGPASGGWIPVHSSRLAAQAEVDASGDGGYRVVGPYVLVERVRER